MNQLTEVYEVVAFITFNTIMRKITTSKKTAAAAVTIFHNGTSCFTPDPPETLSC